MFKSFGKPATTVIHIDKHFTTCICEYNGFAKEIIEDNPLSLKFKITEIILHYIQQQTFS